MTQNPWTRKPMWSDADIERAIEEQELSEYEADCQRAIDEKRAAESELYERRAKLHADVCEVRAERRKLGAVLYKQQRYLAAIRAGEVQATDASVQELRDEIRAVQLRIKSCTYHEAGLLEMLDATNGESDIPWHWDIDDIPPQPAAA